MKQTINATPKSSDNLHRQALTTPTDEIVRFLTELLTRRLTAFIVGVDGKTITRWASGEVGEIRDPWAEQRLLTTYQISQLLLQQNSPRVVRAWFIGLDPALDDISPAEALHSGLVGEAISAAHAFASGS